MAEVTGARIRYWRMRRGGMTQAALAGLAGVSQPFVSQVEAGRKVIDRRSTLVAFANALQVSVADLLDQPGDPTDPLKLGAAAAVPAIRLALVEIEEGDLHPPVRGRAEMDAAVAELLAARTAANYSRVAALLPSLLPDAAAYGGVDLVQVGDVTANLLRNIGYRDLARAAARLTLDAALSTEDPAWIGAGRFHNTISMPTEAAATTSRLAARALDDLQDAAGDPRARQMLGLLHLSASFACAVDDRADDATAHLDEAAREANSLGDPVDGLGFNLSCFGPTNINLWRMEVAAELGDFGRVLDVARSFDPRPLGLAIRRQSYWCSYGRALAHSGRTDREALAAFTQAERAAPAPFSLNSMARDSIASMVHRARRRAVPAELRTLARRVGVEASVG